MLRRGIFRSALDRISNRKFPSLASLFASEDYANIRGLVSTQLRLAEPREDQYFVEPNLRLSQEADSSLTIEGVSQLLATPTPGKTNLVLVDGPAGVGKTRFLQRLEWHRANENKNGRNVAPLLYVSSRGARLSNLRSELAASTQRLRADFTYDQVPVLMQLGLLCLAIDGFDELVDADGYKDAWFALSDFLESLNGKGTCILSGRDTFFDQQGFLDRIDKAKAGLILNQVHVAPLETKDAIEWLRNVGWPNEELARGKTKEVLREGSYALRPYFLSELAKAKGWDALSNATSTRGFLIDQFISREAALIQKFAPIDQQSASSGLRTMFTEVAKDMAERESNEVDIDYLSFLCDYAFGEHLDEDEIRKIAHKAGSVGLLEKAQNDRSRRFPHTEIKHHFLSLSILGDLANSVVPLSLRRSILGTDFIEVMQDCLEAIADEEINSSLSFLESVLVTQFSSDRLPQNGGAILLGSLTRAFHDDTRLLTGLQVNECRLEGPLTPAKIQNCEIYRLDARGADFEFVEFTHTLVSQLIVDRHTRFGNSLPVVDCLLEVSPETTYTLRDPSAISEKLRQSMPTSALGLAETPLLKYFERLCKKAIKQFYFKVGGDDFGADLIDSDDWEKILPVLEKYNRVEFKNIPTSGKSADMIHIKEPASLLEPEESDAEAKQIREEIRKIEQ